MNLSKEKHHCNHWWLRQTLDQFNSEYLYDIVRTPWTIDQQETGRLSAQGNRTYRQSKDKVPWPKRDLTRTRDQVYCVAEDLNKVYLYKTSLSTHQPSRRHIPEEHHYSYRREEFISRIRLAVWLIKPQINEQGFERCEADSTELFFSHLNAGHWLRLYEQLHILKTESVLCYRFS
jgi:hypothetical protein